MTFSLTNPVTDANPLPTTGPGATSTSPIYTQGAGTAYTDVSVASLSVGQAAGTAAVIAANTVRRAFAITPVSDGGLYLASAAGLGFYWPLYAGVTRSLTGQDCPTGALFVTGQTVATKLVMAEG